METADYLQALYDQLTRDSYIIWLAICIVLVFLMQGGFLLLETGLVRSKNSINVAAKNIVDVVLTTIVFWALGYGLFSGKSIYGIFGSNNFFFNETSDKASILYFLYQSAFCATAVTIISGAIAERIYAIAYIKLILVIMLIPYPLIAHWTWNTEGWLYTLGFRDFAGSTTVHSVGGWAAFVLLQLIGPRKGRFDTKQSKIQASNIPMAGFGFFILWVGWFGFNAGNIQGDMAKVPLILLNTHLAGMTGVVGAVAVYLFRYRKLNPSVIMAGGLSGLVAITANCHLVVPINAIIIGFISGMLTMLAIWTFEKFKIDDPIAAVPVHLVAGIWGTLALALFGDISLFPNANSRLEQLGIQILGIVMCGAFVSVFIYFGYRLFNYFSPMRVTEQEEEYGLNIVEHDASTELYDFYRVLNQREEEEEIVVFTEIGQLARNYKDRLEKDLREKTQSLRNFLQLTQQGFLSFDKDFLIDVGYSEHCQTIFNRENLAGMHFGELLYKDKKRQQHELIETLDLFFHRGKRSDVIFKILDKSLILQDSNNLPKEIKLQYKETSDKKILCIITDITVTKELEQQVKATTDYQKKLLKVVTNNRFFSQFLDNTKDLFLLYQQAIKDDQFFNHSQNISQMYLLTHDLKANMGFFGFDDSLEKLHDMETLLLSMLEDKIAINHKDFTKLVANIEKIFNQEMSFYRNSLGEEWYENFESLMISTKNVDDLQKLVANAYPQDKNLFQKISFLKIKPFVKLTSSLKQLSLDIAYQLDKKVRPLAIKIPNDLVLSNEISKPLLRVFPHVVRNMIDHGIETSKQRLTAGKDMYGKIDFEVTEQKIVEADEETSYCVFTFRDDGGGIDLEKIKKICLQKGLLKDNSVINKQALLTYIFDERFSTKEIATTISGRGVGLASLKKEVNKLQGKISVKTISKQGTEINIKIPQRII